MPHDRIQQKIHIGSMGGRVSYATDERAFHHDDVPKRATVKKTEVLDMKRSNITGVRQDGWNTSTYTAERMCVRKARQNSKYDRSIYKYNYRAELLPATNPEYIPKASKLEFDRRGLLTEETRFEATQRLVSATVAVAVAVDDARSCHALTC